MSLEIKSACLCINGKFAGVVDTMTVVTDFYSKNAIMYDFKLKQNTSLSNVCKDCKHQDWYDVFITVAASPCRDCHHRYVNKFEPKV